MECGEVRSLIDPYVDGELDVVRHAEIDAHLEHCRACRSLVEARRAVQSAVRTDGEYFRATATLERRVRESLRGEPMAFEAGRRRGRLPGMQDAAWRPESPRAWRTSALPALAAGLILVLASTVAWLVLVRPTTDDLLARDIVASHIRSLMPGHLTDVPSSDQHTVKPWFNGKADFSPPVRDLASDGFPLIGGRLDYVGGRMVAALVYRRRQHLINLFVWPSASRTALDEPASRRGYNQLRWTAQGYMFWTISDLNAAELKQFARLLQ